MLVLLVIAAELLPLILGVGLYGIVTTNGIAATPIELVLWGLLSMVLATLSIYMICSSIFALYIVCLPNMTPMRALRSARELVRYRRWAVIRKVIFLPCILLALAACILIPLILLATPLASWVFLLLSTTLLAIVHAYIYAVYRSLL
jgi:hypothetical protein